MHAFRVFPADDVQQFVQFRTDTFHLCRRAGIEQDFLQEEIVFAQHALGDGHVALEGGTRSILVFHDGRKHEGRYERDGQGVGHGFVVFVERVFKDVQLQTLVEVFEENLAQMVAFLDDDGVFGAQFVEVGKRGTEHRVGGHVTETAVLVKLFQPGFHGGNVADDAVFRQERKHLVERIEGIFHRGGIDDQFWLEFLDFIRLGKR